MNRSFPENRPLPAGRSAGTDGRHHVREDVPYALRISAAWAWRVGLILVVGGLLVWLLSFVSLLIIPLMVAALISALISPVVRFLRKAKVPKSLAVAITILGFLGLIGGALSLVGRQLYIGFSELWDQVLQGIGQVQGWLTNGPLRLTNEQLNSYLNEALQQLQSNSSAIFSSALSVGSTAGHLFTGLLLTIFALIFFLYDGERIWRFIVGLLPKKARAAGNGAGRKGWTSMVQYIRVQMFVAFVDAVGIGVGAAIIGVPLALPLGVLVFLGSFIPIIGALVTGFVAVLLALVANGWVNALIMLAIVLGVQQLEGHVLQPLVMGKAVSLHPLAVVLAVAGGSMVAGIAGALFAVPLLAILNSVVKYIAGRGWETDPALGAPPPVEEPYMAPEPALASPGPGNPPETSDQEPVRRRRVQLRRKESDK
ncbi:AI-2E family transporter [Arthrobacter sp. CAU 1506]|uniref:AI-2E family transporter n=1 Tax=Arthrobacter sp. CAU 1506 TaxID=2560052 RepID=UPI0010AC6901|nr:AI-2E family transporter [Arthrobacter sp. CAU 1506]TJY72427.1 AI-2E family transporter [Arthrobacter sp. CAU 1506]